jgi:hypothetical protein
MTAALDYFTPIDQLVIDAICEFAEITGGDSPLVPSKMIQVWDRASDPKGDVESSAWGGWIRVVPGKMDVDLVASNATARFRRGYSVEYGHQGLKREDCSKIETAILRAVARLQDLKQADGETPIEQPSPLHVVSVLPTQTDPERAPIEDAERWTDVVYLVVDAWAARADLVAAPAVPTVESVAAAFDSADTGSASGRVTDAGGAASLIEVGVCWAGHIAPTIADNKAVISIGIPWAGVPFTFEAAGAMVGLVPGTTYYARLYATNSAGTGYGEVVQVVYPFAAPISFTYHPDLLRLIGQFTRTLKTSSSIPNTGWSAVVPTPWPASPRWTMCFENEVGSASGETLEWHGAVEEESDDPLGVSHTVESEEFADEWGVPVPAFNCPNITLEET